MQATTHHLVAVAVAGVLAQIHHLAVAVVVVLGY
jgi:hypothetical protein